MATLFDHRGNPIQDGPPERETPSRTHAEMAEVAYAQKDDLARGFVEELLQPDDDVLTKRPGEFLEAYEKLRSDDQVKSTLQQRRTAIVSRPWEVKRGADDAASRSAADWLRDMVTHVGWDRVVGLMHYGVFYGYAVAELLYEADGEYVGVEQIKVRDRSRFRFDREFRLRLVTPYEQTGEQMPARKFWVYTTGADHDDSVYGLGLAHFLYWPVYFKRNGVRIWLNTLEAASRGAPYGTYPPGAPQGEQNKLLTALQILRDGGSAIWPDGMNVDTLDINRSGAPSPTDLYDRMNRAISKIVLSQTLTTDADATGLGSGTSDVQGDVADAVKESDADLITGSFCHGQPNFEGPLQWLMEWNFPGATPPRLTYVFQDEEDQGTAAERDATLSTAGWVRTQESMDEKYGEGYVRKESVSGARPEQDGDQRSAASFAAETDTSDVTVPSAAAAGVRDDADAELASFVEQVRGLLADAGSLPEFSRRLIELYPDMDVTDLADALGNGMTAAHLAGRVQVAEENDRAS